MAIDGFDAYNSTIGGEVHCPNQLRSMEKTAEDSKKLWEFAKETKSLDKLDAKSAELGVRDQVNRKFCKKIFKFEAEKISLLAALDDGKDLPDHMNQEFRQELLELEEHNYNKMFNQFLELKGFDMVKDTPVEVLHVFLLGAVKYLFGNFMKGLDINEKEELLALWYSFNTFSLNIPPFDQQAWYNILQVWWVKILE
ncbi:hypothetical protein PTTG_05188 [Puccinia triticina 1-1 BBBD Race 1]|uniref:Uncharacterized protein n=1 Tax=Puccinia triticina (isolate 1-1 / race 1 (BBBD)) TaxID=630390 RepID=A0A0C4EWJ3_PUCT1|nr:hypothetical protein PTTG_05188 [Puccinia triticina 1-1 BBBD Race 1]